MKLIGVLIVVVFVVGLHAQDLTSDPSGTDPTSNPNASDPMSYPSPTDSTPVFNEETLGPYAPYMKAFEEIQTFKVKITESFYANFAKFTTACNSLATTYRLFGVIMDNLLKNSVAKKIGGTAVLQKRIRADVARVNPSIIWNEIQIIKDQLLIQIRDDCTNNFLQNLTSVITDFPKAAPCVTASLPAIHSALTILASEADMKIREEEATLEGQVNAVKSKISSFGNAFAYQLKRACNTNVKCVVPYINKNYATILRNLNALHDEVNGYKLQAMNVDIPAKINAIVAEANAMADPLKVVVVACINAL